MAETILQVDHVTKRFGGLIALNDVSIQVSEGELVGLIGPNGAGKTTLFNTIAGAYYATEGKITFHGQDITRMPAHKRCHAGIGRTYQITKPFAGMTVQENVAIGGLYGHENRGNVLSGKRRDECMEEAGKILDRMGLGDKKTVKAGTLNVPERKRLEICRALATSPKLLLLDEVVAGLNPSEVEEMVALIREVNESGVTILMIEHVMKAVMQLSHRMYVLNFGKLIATGSPEEISSNPNVIEAYLGNIGQKEAKNAGA